MTVGATEDSLLGSSLGLFPTGGEDRYEFVEIAVWPLIMQNAEIEGERVGDRRDALICILKGHGMGSGGQEGWRVVLDGGHVARFGFDRRYCEAVEVQLNRGCVQLGNAILHFNNDFCIWARLVAMRRGEGNEWVGNVELRDEKIVHLSGSDVRAADA